MPTSSMAMPWECQKVLIDDSLTVAFVLQKGCHGTRVQQYRDGYEKVT